MAAVAIRGYDVAMFSTLQARRKLLVSTLERNVTQPACGCRLDWSWEFNAEDALLPVSVEVAKLRLCHRHAGDRVHQATLIDDFRQRLLTRLSNATRDQAKRSD